MLVSANEQSAATTHTPPHEISSAAQVFESELPSAADASPACPPLPPDAPVPPLPPAPPSAPDSDFAAQAEPNATNPTNTAQSFISRRLMHSAALSIRNFGYRRIGLPVSCSDRRPCRLR